MPENSDYLNVIYVFMCKEIHKKSTVNSLNSNILFWITDSIKAKLSWFKSFWTKDFKPKKLYKINFSCTFIMFCDLLFQDETIFGCLK